MKTAAFRAAILILLLGLARPVAAQGRGSLQVSARVLPAPPSRAILTQALGGPTGPVELARISREIIPATADSVTTARRPRARVTIAFVRN